MFREGKSLRKGILRVMVRKVDKTDFPVKVAFSVPGKMIRGAVRRNLLKRRMREAYRLNKSPFIEAILSKGISCHLMFIYIDRDIRDYHRIESDLTALLEEILRRADSLPGPSRE